MSKFSNYLASYITPQMTLLEKFNALLKYIEEYEIFGATKLYKHSILLQSPSTIEIISTSNDKYIEKSDGIQSTDIVNIMITDGPATSELYFFNGYSVFKINNLIYLEGNRYSNTSKTMSKATTTLDITNATEIVVEL